MKKILCCILLGLIISCAPKYSNKNIIGKFENPEKEIVIELTTSGISINGLKDMVFGYKLDNYTGTYEIKNDEISATFTLSMVVIFKILNKDEIKCIMASEYLSYCKDVVFKRQVKK